jgi:hypothetical protein
MRRRNGRRAARGDLGMQLRPPRHCVVRPELHRPFRHMLSPGQVSEGQRSNRSDRVCCCTLRIERQSFAGQAEAFRRIVTLDRRRRLQNG